LHDLARIAPSPASGAGRRLRRAGALAAALLGGAAACAPAALAATPTVVVVGDSVIVTGQSFGPMTVRATRPDAITHRPVVIGQYAGNASPMGPFTVNTTEPTPMAPDGDCWQKGALSSALTPDLRPGDTVTVTQSELTGQQTSTSVPVTAETLKAPLLGPIPACRKIAPWARNAVTSRPATVADGPIALSGVAQKFAKRVSVSARRGGAATAPVAVSPAGNGRWSATIPARQVGRLAKGPLAVTPVFQVPDVSSGAMANIAGVATQVSKSAAARHRGGSSPGPSGPRTVRVKSLRRPAPIGLGSARRKGIRASFVVPAGARVVRVRLQRAGRTLMQRVVRARNAGSRQGVRLHGPRLRRVLYRGRFRLAVSAGPSRARLGPPAIRTIVVR
jgi:hypothetical protein